MIIERGRIEMDTYTIDLTQPAPEKEPQRQFYFMEKAKLFRKICI